MNLDSPTTKEISENIIAQLEAALNQTIPQLPKSFMRVLAKVLGGVFVILYKYGGFSFLQMFVAHASNESTEINGQTLVPLAQWGNLIGEPAQAPATQAELLVDVGVERTGDTLPSGSQLINTTNGVTYLTLSSTLLTGTNIAIPVRASADQAGGDGAGELGNLDAGAALSFANPLPAVQRLAAVQSVTTAGEDGETTEQYRARIVRRFQARPQGGAYTDYYNWGVSVPGIPNVYPYTGDTPGTVDVYVESDTGTPTSDQLQAVHDAINLDNDGRATRRPVGAAVNTYPVQWITFETTVADLVSDNQDKVKQDIEAGIAEYFTRREPYIVGLSPLPQKNRVTRSGVAGVVDDVVTAAGGIVSSVTITRANVFVDVYTLGAGEKAESLGVIYE